MKYIIINFLWLTVYQLNACWHPTYTPGEYFVFYAYDVNNNPASKTTAGINIEEWKQFTHNKASYKDIWEVVYEYSVEDMIRVEKKELDSGMQKNTFIQYLHITKDKEVIPFLILAKTCEERRSYRIDKWWYPTKEDLKFDDLEEVVEKALAYKGIKLRTRYLLQAVRAAYSMGDFDLCLQLWDDQIKNQPSSAVKTMCEDYIGGIYFQRGDYEKAIHHYANTLQTSRSFWWCADKVAPVHSDIERIKILYTYCPTAPELAEMVQKICREAENKANIKIFDGIEDPEAIDEYGCFNKNRDRFIALRDFALTVASENRSDNSAMWQYAAAFLTLMDNQPKQASTYLQKAASLKGTSFVKTNIRIFQMMLDAMNEPYTAVFETKMLFQLQWLDQMVIKHLTKEIKKEYLNWEKTMFANYSMFYFNDMMRKVTLSIMVPQYLKLGKPVKALMLSGMASERMRMLTKYRKAGLVNQGEDKWNIDFYTDVFNLMDTLPVESIIQYKHHLQKGGVGAFERFLAKRCYKNDDYFNEIMGTKYMRNLQFDKAVTYLSKVRSGYDTTLNIYEYFVEDPFYEPYAGRKYRIPYSFYKKRFAIQMATLQMNAGKAANNEEKAEALYQYAVGLQSSVGHCWALLRYKKGLLHNYSDDLYSVWGKNIKNQYLTILDSAMRLTNQPELKVKGIVAKMWIQGDDRYVYDWNKRDGYSKQKNRNSVYQFYKNKVETQYQSTEMYARLKSECDVFSSY